MGSFSTSDFFNLDFEYQEITEGRDWMDFPEQRLIWAIIERSVRDALGNQVPDAMAAIEWFWKADNQKAEAFSFQWCCETLELDANQIREKILRAREQLNKPQILESKLLALAQ